MKLGGIELFNKTDPYKGVSFLRKEQILDGYRSNFLRNAIPYGYKYTPNSPKVSQSSSSLWSVFKYPSFSLRSIFFKHVFSSSYSFPSTPRILVRLMKWTYSAVAIECATPLRVIPQSPEGRRSKELFLTKEYIFIKVRSIQVPFFTPVIIISIDVSWI